MLPTCEGLHLSHLLRPFLICIREEKTKGFTLLELLTMVTIVGILSSIAIPNYYSYIDKARNTKTISELRMLERGIYAFHAADGVYPETLDDLGMGIFNDSWGNPYQYLNITTTKNHGKVRKLMGIVPLNEDFDLYSMGKDGESQSPLTAKQSHDDIVRAQNGKYLGPAKNLGGF